MESCCILNQNSFAQYSRISPLSLLVEQSINLHYLPGRIRFYFPILNICPSFPWVQAKHIVSEGPLYNLLVSNKDTRFLMNLVIIYNPVSINSWVRKIILILVYLFLNHLFTPSTGFTRMDSKKLSVL